jgi:hypothetical protein
MRRGDEPLFKQLFPPLFVSCILANQKLREQLKERDARPRESKSIAARL